MDECENKLTPQEAKELADNATQTRFNWAINFLAFIAGLVGLLQIAEPYESRYGWWAFSIPLFVAYSFLSLGLSYSVYATFHTSYLIIYLRKLYETSTVVSFLEKYWSRRYAGLIVVYKNNEPIFRKWFAVFLSVLVIILSMSLLVFLFLSKSW